MRRTHLIISIALVGTLAASCGMMDEHAAIDPDISGAADEKLDVAIASTQVTTQAIKDYAFAQRDQFTSDGKAELVTILAELNKLSAKADDAARADLKTKLKAARTKWTEAKQRLDQAERATESDWKDVQRGFNTSYGELHAAIDEARRWLSEKIDPETGKLQGERNDSVQQD